MKLTYTALFILFSILASHAQSESIYKNDSESGAAICQNIGDYIFRMASKKNATYLDYVLFNTSSHAERLKIIETKFPTNDQTTLIDHYLEQLPSKKIRAQNEIEKDVYKNSKSIVEQTQIAQALLKHWSQIPKTIINYSAYARLYDIAEPVFKYNDNYSRGAQLISKVWVKVYSNKSYVRPLLLLVKKLNSQLISNKTTSSTLFEDLVNAFISENISRSKSIEMAWDILGLYGSQGSAIGLFSLSYDKDHTGIGYALDYLSYLLSVLDTLNRQNGKPLYSIPKNFQTNCAIGRPYHFWMSAYLSHQLKLENYSTESSNEAAYFLGEMYEYYFSANGRYYGKDMPRSFVLLNYPIRHVELSSTRLSFVLHAAGAAFGTQNEKEKNKITNLDSILNQSVIASKEPLLFDLSQKTGIVNPLMRFYNLKQKTAADFIFDKITDIQN